jgi:hypothetical protein
MSGQIVKSGNARPAQAQGGMTAIASIEDLRAQADEIKMVADIFGIEGDQLRHLKVAFFYAGVGNGLVPDVFKGDYRSMFIMSQISDQMKLPLSEVLQGCYFVHGRLGWYAEWMIKRILALGIFTAFDYEVGGDLKDETLWCRAVGTRPDGTKAIGTVVSLKMARAEGWFDKKGSKWLTMPAYMLKKRAATFLIRECAPHIFGNNTLTAEEAEEIEPATPDKPQLIETKVNAATTMAMIIADEEKKNEEQQRLDLLDRVEKKIASKIQGGVNPVDIENSMGMALGSVPELNIEQLMAVWEMISR